MTGFYVAAVVTAAGLPVLGVAVVRALKAARDLGREVRRANDRIAEREGVLRARIVDSRGQGYETAPVAAYDRG